MTTDLNLSRREREIMNILFESGSGTAAEVRDAMTDPPSYSAVRATLRILERKGHVTHEHDGPRYLWKPTVSHSKAKTSALKHMVQTFFAGNTRDAVAALLNLDSGMSEDEYRKLASLIEQARQKDL